MTIKELSKLAGVSIATVSRVLNHPELVQPATREHVLKIMKEYNYAPNWNARSLRKGKSGIIVLLISKIERLFDSMVVSGVETIASNKNYNIVLGVTNEDKDAEIKYVGQMLDRDVDGLILVNSQLKKEQVRRIVNKQIPLVHVGKQSDGAFKNQCYIDHENSIYRLMLHLFSLRHKTFNFFIDPFASLLFRQVQTGIKMAMYEAPPDVNITFSSVESSVSGGRNTLKQLASIDELPDVVVCGTVEQVMGVIDGAQQLGLNIPEDLALVSLSDAPVCSILRPPITSVSQPVTRLGMMAARMLFDIIESTEISMEPPNEISLKAELLVRYSCGNTKHIYETFE
ncbi:MAG: LacI family transcriptional regulator [Clostridiaceae bacterium]|nr:LacI family transcriptional regulator [Clostridiaceae bacterium]